MSEPPTTPCRTCAGTGTYVSRFRAGLASDLRTSIHRWMYAVGWRKLYPYQRDAIEFILSRDSKPPRVHFDQRFGKVPTGTSASVIILDDPDEPLP
jgi:hypothetical protein